MERTIRRRIMLRDPRYSASAPDPPTAPTRKLTVRQPAHQFLRIPDSTRTRDGTPETRAVPPHDIVPVFECFPFFHGEQVAEGRVTERDGFVGAHLGLFQREEHGEGRRRTSMKSLASRMVNS